MTDRAAKPTRKPWTPYLRTLRRIPRHIILDLASRHLDENSSQTCICGWAARGALADLGRPEYWAMSPPLVLGDPVVLPILRFSEGTTPDAICHEKFGGTQAEWRAVYYGAAGLEIEGLEVAPEEAAQVAVETALAIRVAECSAGRR